MKKKTNYSNEPMGKLKIVSDFLPPPHELVFKEKTTKITISLSHSSIDFFKKSAKEQRTPYQKMIRKVLDLYAAHYQ